MHPIIFSTSARIARAFLLSLFVSVMCIMSYVHCVFQYFIYLLSNLLFTSTGQLAVGVARFVLSSFLVFQSKYCNSSLVHLRICATYITVNTAEMFITLIMFTPFSFLQDSHKLIYNICFHFLSVGFVILRHAQVFTVFLFCQSLYFFMLVTLQCQGYELRFSNLLLASIFL